MTRIDVSTLVYTLRGHFSYLPTVRTYPDVTVITGRFVGPGTYAIVLDTGTGELAEPVRVRGRLPITAVEKGRIIRDCLEECTRLG